MYNRLVLRIWRPKVLLLIFAGGLLSACAHSPSGGSVAVPNRVDIDYPHDPSEELAAHQIVVGFTDSLTKPADPKRSRSQAYLMAQELLERLLAGEDFEQVARAHGDGGTASRGGNIGAFRAGQMPGNFALVVYETAIGTIHPGIVETKYGFHIVRRDSTQALGARHILVMWKGSERSPPEITRSKDEARERAQLALELIQSGADFAGLATQYGDGPSAEQGGDLGTFKSGQMVPEFEEATRNTPVGELHPKVVETVFGFHVIFRTL